MKENEIFQEVGKCFTDWEGFLANKNCTLRRNIVSWPNCALTILDEVTWDTVSDLASSKQYSFQLSDGSIVQMLYDFSTRGAELKSAMLAYYENHKQEEPDEETEGEVLPLDESPVALKPKWLRMDFEVKHDSNSIHAHCHLHLSGFPDTRISCAGVPGPRQFLESLLAWLYPNHYRETVLSQEHEALKTRHVDINRICLPLTPREHFNSLLHLALPPSVRYPGDRVGS
jgi:hypothetical protein